MKKSFQDGLSLPEFQQKITLTHDLIDEALILSDLFDLNELVTVELLLTGWFIIKSLFVK